MKKKSNWVDTTVIVVILLAIILFLNKDKVLNMGSKESTSNERDIILVVEGDAVTENMITDLKIGDQIFSQDKLQNAKVEKITTEPLTRVSRKRRDSYEDAEEIKAIVEIHGKVAFSGPYMDLGGQEIKVGLPFIMKTTKVEFPSTIKYIEVK